MLRKDNSLRYYLSGAAGFFISFATLVSPFAYYYKVRADELKSGVNLSQAAIPVMTTTAISMSPPASTVPFTVANATPREVASRPEPVANQVEAVAYTAPEIAPATPLSARPAELTPSRPASQPALPNEGFKPGELESMRENAKQHGYQQHPASYKFLPGKVVKMEATAYCLNGITASGVKSKYGVVAADPSVLPIGSVVRLYAGEYSGLYTVMDTGSLIKGQKLDIYLTNSKEAMIFGRRKIAMEILRYGWNPQATTPPPDSPAATEPETSEE